jgi:DNA adenine methylase
VLVEPFAGGGSIGLAAAFHGVVDKVVMVELDEQVASVWKTILHGDAEWLAQRILGFEMNRENLERELSRTPASEKEKAFHAILRNRTLHGGRLVEKNGFIKKGTNGKGLLSYWFPKAIARRINAIKCIADKIDFRHDDGLEVMKEFADRNDVIYFVDPPYTTGRRPPRKELYKLYKHHNITHGDVFAACASVRGEFLLTYNDTEDIKELSCRYGFQMRSIKMKNLRNAIKHELVIGRDLSCLNLLLEVS